MIIIRQTQIHALTEALYDPIVEALASDLGMEKSAASKLLFLARVRYGIEQCPDLVRFANLVRLLGPDFDQGSEHRWVREMLLDQSVPMPSRRLQRAEQAVIKRQQIQAYNRHIDALVDQ